MRLPLLSTPLQRLLCSATALCVVLSLGGRVEAQIITPAALEGRVATQAGTVDLAAATVTLLREPDGALVATELTTEDGRFRFDGVPPGWYRVIVEVPGFDPVIAARDLVLTAGETRRLDLDVPLGLRDSVEAVAAPDAAAGSALDSESTPGARFDVLPLRGDDYRALLPILPGVLRGPDGKINLKGGRPAQTGLQVGPAYANDPTTGDVAVSLPVDAVADIDVLPNPFAAEFGRFSAGITRVETRRGGDDWEVGVNDVIPIPCLKLCSGKQLGPRNYAPRVVVSGPLVADRISLTQSVQYHDHRNRVTSLPRSEADTTLRSLDAFTRADMRLGRHQITATAAFFPQNLGEVGLDTFHRRPVSPDVRRRGFSISLTDTLALSDTVALESTISQTTYDIRVEPDGDGLMTIGPEATTGSFFNRQQRKTGSVQWVETLSIAREAAGDHLIRVGVDTLWLDFDGFSESRPVEIRRADGSLAERLTFGPATTHDVHATDVALFGQDRWRVSDRLLVEGGIRLDRDGVTGDSRVSPRLGFTVGVLPAGRGVLRGGIGLFAERTPLLAAAFPDMETPTVTRFTGRGPVAIATPFEFSYQNASDLRPAAARVWNLEYNQRLASGWVLRLGHLVRHGNHELILVPDRLDGRGTLTLQSTGESSYHETEATLRYADDHQRELTATYVRSSSRSNLNTFDEYFGNLRNPILRDDEYGRTRVDVPNRFVGIGVVPIGDWLVSALLEIRDGFPYSEVDEQQDFVGPRQESGRFPVFYTLDLQVTRALRIFGRNLRLGVKATHLLGTFMPRDVQTNVDAPDAGTFYNPISRRIRLTFAIGR